MALMKTTQYKGLEIKDCYFRIWKFDGNKDKVSFGVGLHKDSSSPMIDSVSFTFNYDLEGPNLIEQAYIFLKTTSYFSGAIDC